MNFLALCAGAVLQFRVLGGALGLAVASTVWNNYATKQLQLLLPQDQLEIILKSTAAIPLLPGGIRERVIEIMIHSYNLRMKALIGFTSAQLIAVGMMGRIPDLNTTKADAIVSDLDPTKNNRRQILVGGKSG